MQPALELLIHWVRAHVSGDRRTWFDTTLTRLQGRDAADRALYIALGLTPRRLGKDDLKLDAEDLAAARAVRPGWDPSEWSLDQAARLAFLLTRFDGDEERFFRLMETLFRTADVGELVCFYRGLPLYPGQELYLRRAREGARTNMKPVFEAVAHRNPYPRERFDEAAWNQMVLKALFIESRLDPIQGLDARRNPELARMLVDYAHERWAAGRSVSPELWRCVGPYAQGRALDDLARVLESSDPRERQAAALALFGCPDPRARALLAQIPGLEADITRGTLTWSTLAAGLG